MGIGVRNSLFRGSTARQCYCDTTAPSDAGGRAGELPHITLHGFQSWRRSISYAYLLPCPIKLPSLTKNNLPSELLCHVWGCLTCCLPSITVHNPKLLSYSWPGSGMYVIGLYWQKILDSWPSFLLRAARPLFLHVQCY